jgi:hypothetical protein
MIWVFNRSGSSTQSPGGEVLALLVGQGVDGDSHGLELESRDTLVDRLGNLVHLVFELTLFAGGPTQWVRTRVSRECLI